MISIINQFVCSLSDRVLDFREFGSNEELTFGSCIYPDKRLFKWELVDHDNAKRWWVFADRPFVVRNSGLSIDPETIIFPIAVRTVIPNGHRRTGSFVKGTKSLLEQGKVNTDNILSNVELFYRMLSYLEPMLVGEVYVYPLSDIFQTGKISEISNMCTAGISTAFSSYPLTKFLSSMHNELQSTLPVSKESLVHLQQRVADNCADLMCLSNVGEYFAPSVPSVRIKYEYDIIDDLLYLEEDALSYELGYFHFVKASVLFRHMSYGCQLVPYYSTVDVNVIPTEEKNLPLDTVVGILSLFVEYTGPEVDLVVTEASGQGGVLKQFDPCTNTSVEHLNDNRQISDLYASVWFLCTGLEEHNFSFSKGVLSTCGDVTKIVIKYRMTGDVYIEAYHDQQKIWARHFDLFWFMVVNHSMIHLKQKPIYFS